jgi:hypothetical protein
MKRNSWETFAVAAIAVAYLSSIGCSSGMTGTYSDPAGGMVLDLKSGGKASLSFQGDIADCSYRKSGSQLTVNCEGLAGQSVFNIHDDGSLTLVGPGGGFVPALRKQK